MGTAARGDFFRVFLGNGDGTFALQFEHSINGCYDCAIGDLNGDGITEIATGTMHSCALVRDVASVELGHQKRSSFVRSIGKPALAMNVS